MNTFAAYREEMLKTYRSALEPDDLLINFTLGLTGEAGEFADEVKKVLFHGKPRDIFRLRDELGDVLWYLAATAEALGVTLEQVAADNVAKLRARHGDSGFKPHGEQNR